MCISEASAAPQILVLCDDVTGEWNTWPLPSPGVQRELVGKNLFKRFAAHRRFKLPTAVGACSQQHLRFLPKNASFQVSGFQVFK
jgi:hypothetical protein